MKRLCLFIAVCFLILGLISSCSLEETGFLEEDKIITNSDPDKDEENSEEEPTEKDDEEEEEEPEAPSVEFLFGKFVSETEIEFEFSLPVRVLSLSFDPPMESGLVEEGSLVTVFLDESPKPGMRFTTYIEAEDEWENIITVETILYAKNNRVPKLQINELRTEWSNSASRAEFIEFKILSEGNLGALRVFVASNNANPMIYQFLPVEVGAGEYVVLHLRTLEQNLVISEYGDCLEESGGRDSSPLARDIWIPGSSKLLRKTDAVYIMDLDDNVLDAVMISETQAAIWNRDFLIEAARFLFYKGAWSSPAGEICLPADAVSSIGIGSAVTRSISRNETMDNVGNATNWYVTGNGGATPGGPNRLQ